MYNGNFAEHARSLSDGELAAVAKVYADEQKRRKAERPQGGFSDPELNEMMTKHYEELYGKNY